VLALVATIPTTPRLGQRRFSGLVASALLPVRYPFLMTRIGTGVRTYLVETHGCQMNVHDSERIGGLLEAEGYLPARAGEEPDVVVFNT